MEDQGLTREVRAVVNSARQPVPARTVIEAVRRVMPDAKEHSIRAILVTSAQKGRIAAVRSSPGGSKTFCSLEMAEAAARDGKRITPACKVLRAEVLRDANEDGAMEIGLVVKLVPGGSLADTLTRLEKVLGRY
jgi:hypothetical protein